MNKKNLTQACRPARQGFTLIELIIYIGTFSIIITVLTLFTFNLINIQAKTKISKEVLENSQRAMEIMLWEIKHAQGIYHPTSSFGSNPGQLSLITNQNTPPGETFTYVDFYLDDNNRLSLKKEGIEAEALTSEKVNIKSLVFSYLTDGVNQSIRIELLAIYNIPEGKPDYQATTTLISSANLRND